MAYFDCQIVQGGGVILTVTCYSVYAGATITATDGETTLQATCPSSSPYTVEFKIPNSGSWTISGTASGQTGSITVVIPDSATLTPPIPTGSTVTPVNDIQIWLHCANIWNKNYTTIAQVLADASTLQALIASNNAADYMARSTSWANSVTANSTAMTYIGANNYCADKLLNNSTWRTAICDSTYYESVLTSKVPTMTGMTTPSGEVIRSSVLQGTENAWYAFDGIETSARGWNSAVETNPWVGYRFTGNVKIYKVYVNPYGEDYVYAPHSFKVQASTNGSTWVDVSSDTSLAQDEQKTINLTNNNSYRYFRIYITSQGAGGRCNIREIQFYGRA